MAATFGASGGPAITISLPVQWNQIGTTRGVPSCQVYASFAGIAASSSRRATGSSSTARSPLSAIAASFSVSISTGLRIAIVPRRRAPHGLLPNSHESLGWRLVPGDPVPARTNRRCQIAQDRLRRFPADAGVGDALAEGEAGGIGEVLPALDEEALQHDADDARFARGDLLRDGAGDAWLAAVVFAAVAVAGVDHHARRHLTGAEGVERLPDGLGGIVRAAVTAAQDEVAVPVAAGDDDRGQ